MSTQHTPEPCPMCGDPWGVTIQKELDTVKAENRTLREGCSKIASAIGNGSAASPDASVGFLTDSLAEEVRLYCGYLRRELAALRAERDELREALQGLLAHMGDRTASNCLGGLGDSCDKARAVLSKHTTP